MMDDTTDRGVAPGLGREICQRVLPVRPWAAAHTARLPGLVPVNPGEWLLVDDAFDAQMAYREALLDSRRAAVVALEESARAAADELLAVVLSEVAALSGYRRDGERVLRPDGVWVRVDRSDPLGTLGRLVQEDIAILEKRAGEDRSAGEHVLTGAVLCFPASWSLAQKMGRALTTIHAPVESYDAGLAPRVQRLFDGLQVARPIWRANALIYGDADLHQPRREGEGRAMGPGPRWLRVERQTLRRLPESGAVIFGIHTFVQRAEVLSPEDRAAVGLAGSPPDGS